MTFTLAFVLAVVLAQDAQTGKKSNSSTATAGGSETAVPGKKKMKKSGKKKVTDYGDMKTESGGREGGTRKKAVP